MDSFDPLREDKYPLGLFIFIFIFLIKTEVPRSTDSFDPWLQQIYINMYIYYVVYFYIHRSCCRLIHAFYLSIGQVEF